MAFSRGNYQGGVGGGRGRGRGRGGFQSGGRGGGFSNGNQSGQQSGGNLAGVAVKNWSNGNGTKDQLLAWLSRSANNSPIVSHTLLGVRQNVLVIGVHASNTDNFLRLNGRSWAGVQVVVEPSNRPPPQQSQANGGGQNSGQHNNREHNQNQQKGKFGGAGAHDNHQNDTFTSAVQDKIYAVLERRYEVPGKHLNLTALIQEQDILSIPDINTVEQHKVWEAIFTVCKTKIWPKQHDRNINVQAITLSNNALGSVSHIESLARIFPRLHNLDISSNGLETLEALSPFKDQLLFLEHLIIADNPLLLQPDLLPTLRQWFPKLQKVNNLPADGSQGLGPAGPAPGVPGVPAPFETAPVAQQVPTVVVPVAPARPHHPQIPLDSYFAIETPDKSAEILEKERMGLRFSLETGLTIARTEEALRANDWNYQLAMANFEALRNAGQIAPDNYFQRG
jgi:hypothetical protein